MSSAGHFTLKRMNGLASRLLLMLLIAALGGCGDSCENELAQTTISPSGLKQAVVFVRDCGATAGVSTQVSIVAGGVNVVGAGNALVVEGRPSIQVRWLTDSVVSLSGLGPGRIFKQESEVYGTSIRYDNAL